MSNYKDDESVIRSFKTQRFDPEAALGRMAKRQGDSAEILKNQLVETLEVLQGEENDDHLGLSDLLRLAAAADSQTELPTEILNHFARCESCKHIVGALSSSNVAKNVDKTVSRINWEILDQESSIGDDEDGDVKRPSRKFLFPLSHLGMAFITVCSLVVAVSAIVWPHDWAETTVSFIGENNQASSIALIEDADDAIVFDRETGSISLLELTGKESIAVSKMAKRTVDDSGAISNSGIELVAMSEGDCRLTNFSVTEILPREGKLVLAYETQDKAVGSKPKVTCASRSGFNSVEIGSVLKVGSGVSLMVPAGGSGPSKNKAAIDDPTDTQALNDPEIDDAGSNSGEHEVIYFNTSAGGAWSELSSNWKESVKEIQAKWGALSEKELVEILETRGRYTQAVQFAADNYNLNTEQIGVGMAEISKSQR